MTFESLIFDARSVITVASFATFIGIVWWAYSGRRNADFAEAARLPFADENANMEKEHG